MYSALHIPAVLSGTQLTAVMIVACFSAGLNVYATVLMLGLLSRAHALALPAQLQLVQSWEVIVICGILFAVEFVGDKIPVFDLVWNAMQTFVRVPVAALLVYAASEHVPEGLRLVAVLLGSLIALAAHSGKIAARAAVTHSPEPFTNSALSLSEDATVAGLMWFATRHPYISAAIALSLLALVLLMIRVVVRSLKDLIRRLGALKRNPSGEKPQPA